MQPVAENSAAITPEQYAKDPVEYARVEERVRRAGEIMQLRAVGRIDCRRNQQGEFKLFDVNMKPVSRVAFDAAFNPARLSGPFVMTECYWSLESGSRKPDFAGWDGC